jgi:hypothetical protein
MKPASRVASPAAIEVEWVLSLRMIEKRLETVLWTERLKVLGEAGSPAARQFRISKARAYSPYREQKMQTGGGPSGKHWEATRNATRFKGLRRRRNRGFTKETSGSTGPSRFFRPSAQERQLPSSAKPGAQADQ